MTPKLAPLPRQSTACDWCRAHKVKCDTELPSCSNCRRRGVACVTVDLRRPDALGRRVAPRGRRRRYEREEGGRRRVDAATVTATATATASSSSSSPDAGFFVVDNVHALSSSCSAASTKYPPSPELPAQLDFEAGSPERVLPTIFTSSSPPHSDHTECSSGSTTADVSHDGDSSSALTTATTWSTSASDHRHCPPHTPDLVNIATISGSHFILIQWLDLYFARCATWTPVSPLVQRGLPYLLEMPLPKSKGSSSSSNSSSLFPPLPEPGRMQRLVSCFFARFHPVFPVLDRRAFEVELASLLTRPAVDLESGSCYFPFLASVYAVLSAAADEEGGLRQGSLAEESTRYLEAACSLFGMLVASSSPSLASVQALLLLAFVLRNRGKDGASWSTLSQAVCMAQLLGLHRTSTKLDIDHDMRLGARVWWAAYTLERTMALETGRTPLISTEGGDYDHIDLTAELGRSGMEKGVTSFDYFKALVRLAQIKSRAIRLLYHHNHHHQKSTASNSRVRDLLFEMGRIDRALLDWAAAFPESIRPGRDLFCGAEELHLATFVSLQYHQTMIALHRPALLSAPGFLRNRIDEHCAATPWRDRLHFSLCIGAASARAMLKAVNDLLMYAPQPTRLITAGSVFLAVLVLGIYVTKVPMSRMNGADLAMMTTFSRLVQREYEEEGQHEDFIRGIERCRAQLVEYHAKVQCCSGSSSKSSSGSGQQQAGIVEGSTSFAGTPQQQQDLSHAAHDSANQMEGSLTATTTTTTTALECWMGANGNEEEVNLAELEEIWSSSLWGQDFGALLTQQGTTNQGHSQGQGGEPWDDGDARMMSLMGMPQWHPQ